MNEGIELAETTDGQVVSLAKAKRKPSAKKTAKPKAAKKPKVKNAKKKPKPKGKAAVKKTAKPKAKKAAKPKAKKTVKTKAKKAADTVARPCRLDMRLTKAEKAKLGAKAKKSRRTVTSIVLEAIEKVK